MDLFFASMFSSIKEISTNKKEINGKNLISLSPSITTIAHLLKTAIELSLKICLKFEINYCFNIDKNIFIKVHKSNAHKFRFITCQFHKLSEDCVLKKLNALVGFNYIPNMKRSTGTLNYFPPSAR